MNRKIMFFTVIFSLISVFSLPVSAQAAEVAGCENVRDSINIEYISPRDTPIVGDTIYINGKPERVIRVNVDGSVVLIKDSIKVARNRNPSCSHKNIQAWDFKYNKYTKVSNDANKCYTTTPVYNGVCSECGQAGFTVLDRPIGTAHKYTGTQKQCANTVSQKRCTYVKK